MADYFRKKKFMLALAVVPMVFWAGFAYAVQKPKIDCVSSVNIEEQECQNAVPNVTVGHPAFTLTVIGQHFNHTPVIYFGSLGLPTTRINSQKVTAEIAAASLQPANIYYISVVNIEGTSDAVPFTVYNAPPTISNVSSASNFCPQFSDGRGLTSFSWQYNDLDGDNENQFRIQVDNNASFASPEVDRTFSNLSNPAGTINQQSVFVELQQALDSITYAGTFNWRVSVCQVNINPALIGPGGLCSGWVNGNPFTTIVHPKPYVNFTFSATSPAVVFTNNSVCYDADGICNAYLWDFGDGATSTVRNPSHSYPSINTYAAALTVTDGDAFQCSWQQNVNVQNEAPADGLPVWKEVTPFIFAPPPPGFPGCVASGDYCTMNEECCSGVCVIGAASRKYWLAGGLAFGTPPPGGDIGYCQ